VIAGVGMRKFEFDRDPSNKESFSVDRKWVGGSDAEQNEAVSDAKQKFNAGKESGMREAGTSPKEEAVTKKRGAQREKNEEAKQSLPESAQAGIRGKTLEQGSLRINKTGPRSKYLVFTSAGDRDSIECWLKGWKEFDLWVTYYGDRSGKYSEVADFYNVRKGGKFPNLHYAYQQWPEIFSGYEAVMVMDDDVIMSGHDIDRLFRVRKAYGLWVCQPAFCSTGKVEWKITQAQKYAFLRHTNFVEMTCPLFLQSKLNDFMKVYDPVLVGYGCDLWFLHSMGPNLKGKVAIVDAITCVNPRFAQKGEGGREIDRLQPFEERVKVWDTIRERFHITYDIREIKKYSVVPLSSETRFR